MSFAERMNLRPGDVVICPKSEFKIVGHYLVYGGFAYGIHFYYENIRVFGVRAISEEQFARENPECSKIRRFYGNEYQRAQAIDRAKSQLGRKYNVALFNCEDYANYVQYGKAYSQQVNDVATGVVVASIFIGLVAAFGGNERKGK